MVQLKNLQAFAHGNHRHVYRHPEKEDRCLKLMAEHWKESPRWKRATLLGKLVRPHGYFNENVAEYEFSKETLRKVGHGASDFLAIAHGFVESDIGELLEVDLVRNHDGVVSVTLKEYLWENGLTPDCESALQKFWEQLHEHWVFVQARPDNLAVKVKGCGKLQILAIDGYAYTQVIPIAKWFRKEKERKLAKFKRNQKNSIAKILSLRESGDEEGLGSQGIQGGLS